MSDLYKRIYNAKTVTGRAPAAGNREVFNSSLLPGVTDVYDIGSSTMRWNDVYANNGNFTDQLNCGGIASLSNVSVSGTATVETLNVNGSAGFTSLSTSGGISAGTTVTSPSFVGGSYSGSTYSGTGNITTSSGNITSTSGNVTALIGYFNSLAASSTTDATSKTDTSASISTAGGLAVAKSIYSSSLNTSGAITAGDSISVVSTTAGRSVILDCRAVDQPAIIWRSLGTENCQLYKKASTNDLYFYAGSSDRIAFGASGTIQTGSTITCPTLSVVTVTASGAITGTTLTGTSVVSSGSISGTSITGSGTGTFANVTTSGKVSTSSTTDAFINTDTSASIYTAGGLAVTKSIHADSVATVGNLAVGQNLFVDGDTTVNLMNATTVGCSSLVSSGAVSGTDIIGSGSGTFASVLTTGTITSGDNIDIINSGSEKRLTLDCRVADQPGINFKSLGTTNIQVVKIASTSDLGFFMGGTFQHRFYANGNMYSLGTVNNNGMTSTGTIQAPTLISNGTVQAGSDISTVSTTAQRNIIMDCRAADQPAIVWKSLGTENCKLYKKASTNTLVYSAGGSTALTFNSDGTLQFENVGSTKKIVLFGANTDNYQNFAIGTDGGGFRCSLQNTSYAYKWYAGTSSTTETLLMTLNGSSALSVGSVTTTGSITTGDNISIVSTTADKRLILDCRVADEPGVYIKSLGSDNCSISKVASTNNLKITTTGGTFVFNTDGQLQLNSQGSSRNGILILFRGSGVTNDHQLVGMGVQYNGGVPSRDLIFQLEQTAGIFKWQSADSSSASTEAMRLTGSKVLTIASGGSLGIGVTPATATVHAKAASGSTFLALDGASGTDGHGISWRVAGTEIFRQMYLNAGSGVMNMYHYLGGYFFKAYKDALSLGRMNVAFAGRVCQSYDPYGGAPTMTAATGQTYAADWLFTRGVLIRTGIGALQTDTFPAAADIITSVRSGLGSNFTGQSFRFTIHNNTGNGFGHAGNTGTTIYCGNSPGLSANEVCHYLCVITSGTTVTIYGGRY